MRKKIISIGLVVQISIAALFLALISCASGPSSDHSAFSTPATPGKSAVRVLQLINQGRAKKGVDKLTFDQRLILAAKDHADSMNKYGYFDHAGRDGSLHPYRLLRRGYPRVYSAENIAKASNSRLVFIMWDHSHSHQFNMNNKIYSRVGIAQSGNYWVAVFASE